MVSFVSMQASTVRRWALFHAGSLAFLACSLYFAVVGINYARPQAGGLRGQQTPTLPLQTMSDHPLWNVDLHSFGFPSGDSQLQSRRALEEFNTLDFMSDGVLAATFVTQQTVPGAQRRDDANRVRPYLIHAVFLDALTGKRLNSLEWPADDPNAGIFPVFGGGFLFFSEEHLVLYSSDGTLSKEVPLPQLQAPRTGHVGIAESPSGKSLMIRYEHEDSVSCIQIATQDLDISEAPCSVSRLFSISDAALAERSDKKYDRPEVEPVQPVGVGVVQKAELDVFGSVQIRKHEGAARKLCDTSKVAGCKVPQFINNEKVAVFDWYKAALVTTGEESSGDGSNLPLRLAHREWIDIVGRPLRPSRDGQRFAVAINLPPPNSKGKKAGIHAFLGDVPAAYPSHVDVFDLKLSEWVFSLVNRRTGPNSHQFQQIWGLALSPTGEKLAIDSGGVIQLYSIPPGTKAPPPAQ
jgi:hypothetical protein